MAKSAAHPGFKAVAAGMAEKQGIPEQDAAAELAASSRNASPEAKAKNPRLKKVKGKKKKGKKKSFDPNYGAFGGGQGGGGMY